MSEQHNLRRRTLRGLGALLVTAAALGGVQQASVDRARAEPVAPPKPPANGEMGFVVNFFAPAGFQGKDDCPEGFAATLRENYLAMLTIPERTRLLEKANEEELTKRWQAMARGPANTNMCSQPQLFESRPQRTVQGNVGNGLDLDGGEGGCGHQNFTSPSGETGIDNQVWRAMGCVRSWRGAEGDVGDIVRGLNGYLTSGEHSQVILLRGVDSLERDDAVEVIYANTEDRAIVDSKGGFIRDASYTVADKPTHRNVLHGRIVDGVLITEPQDILLRQSWGQGGVRGGRNEWDFRHSVMRLRFAPDGSVQGLLGGYQPIWDVMASASLGGLGAATVAGYDCAAMYAALKQMADGDRDPKTGQCKTISTALELRAVPAFVIDRPEVEAAQRAALQ